MKPQQFVIYKHEDKNLFFVSAVNHNRINEEGNVDKQYSRARSLFKGIEDGTVGEHAGGFYYAIINTNYSGWTAEVWDEIIEEELEFLSTRQMLIDNHAEFYTNVGSDIARMKGEIGKGKGIVNWNKKFNVAKLTRSDIFMRIKKLEIGSNSTLSQKQMNEVYYSIAVPHSFGPKARNFGNYIVDSISNIYLYIHHLKSKAVDA